MPYVKGEYSPDPALQNIGVDDNVVLARGGLNFRLRVVAIDGRTPTDGNYALR